MLNLRRMVVMTSVTSAILIKLRRLNLSKSNRWMLMTISVTSVISMSPRNPPRLKLLNQRSLRCMILKRMMMRTISVTLVISMIPRNLSKLLKYPSLRKSNRKIKTILATSVILMKLRHLLKRRSKTMERMMISVTSATSRRLKPQLLLLKPFRIILPHRRNHRMMMKTSATLMTSLLK